MRRVLLIVCVLLVAFAWAQNAPCADDAMLNVVFRTETSTVGISVAGNPWQHDSGAWKATIILDWDDPDGEANGTQFEIRKSLDGGANWSSVATVYDTDQDGTQYKPFIDVYVKGTSAWAKAFAELKANIMAIEPGTVAWYEVRIMPCDNARGQAELCSVCDRCAGCATAGSGEGDASRCTEGNSPTGFFISYNSWLTDRYRAYKAPGDKGPTRPSDMCPGWFHTYDKRLARFSITGATYMYELWLGGSRFVFWEDDFEDGNGKFDHQFHTSHGVKNFTAWWEDAATDKLHIRYGSRVYTFEEDFETITQDNVDYYWARIDQEMKIYEETSSGFDGYYLSYEYDSETGELEALHEGDGTTQDETTRLLSFTFDQNDRLITVTANTDTGSEGDERTVATLTYSSEGTSPYDETMLTKAEYILIDDDPVTYEKTYEYDYDGTYGKSLTEEMLPSGDKVVWTPADLAGSGDEDSRTTAQNLVYYNERQLKRSTTTNKLFTRTFINTTNNYTMTLRAVEETAGTVDECYATRSYFPYKEESGGVLYTVYKTETGSCTLTSQDGDEEDDWTWSELNTRTTKIGVEGHVAETLLDGSHDGGTFYEKTTYEYTFDENKDVTQAKTRTRRTTAAPSGSYGSTTDYTYAQGNDKIKKVVSQGPDGVKRVTEYVTVGTGASEWAQNRVEKTWVEDDTTPTPNKTNEIAYDYYTNGDAEFKLRQVDNACCGTTDYVWNSDHTLASVEDALGNTTEYVYDFDQSGSFSRAWKVKRPGQNGRTLETVYAYTPSGQVETVTYPPAEEGGTQFSVVYSYDEDGRVTEIERKYGSTSTSHVKYTYATDGSGFLEKIERDLDPNGTEDWVVTAAYTYDLSGATTSVRNGEDGPPESGGDSEVQYVYNAYGQLERKRVRTDGTLGAWEEPDSQDESDNHIVTKYQYYPNGGIWKVTDARSVTIEYEHWDTNTVNDGKLKKVDFPVDTDIEYTYDGTDGYLTEVKQGTPDIDYTYDSFGRLATVTDVWGKQISIDDYNGSGKITEWRYPGYSAGSEIVYTYDDIGRLYEITDKMPAGADKTTEVDYDQDTGAMVKVTLPNGTVTTLEYDDLGRLTALVNAKGDGPGEAIITSYAYHYDNDAIHGGMGQVDRIASEDGRYAEYAYDAHERLTTEHYQTPQDATLYRFDYTYDDDGNRLSKKHDNDSGKVVWFSDETDRTTVDTDFGPSNQLARMWTQGTNTTGTKHTVCGSFTEENIDTVEVVSKTDGDTEVDSVTAQIRDGLFIARALDFVSGANTATKAVATATDKADNTAVDTNTGVDIETSLDVWYEYDAAGRRTKKYEEGEYSSGEPYTEYIWDDAGRLEQVDIDYGTGETPRYARAWLTWDPAGQLVKLEIRVGSSLASLAEGSGGTLVFLKKYTYFGGSVIVERDEVGTPSEKEFVSAAGAYLYQVDASDNYWYYHYDSDGSVAAITNASADIKALYEYDAFGNKLTNAGTVDNAFGFYGGTLFEYLNVIDSGAGHFLDPETGVEISSFNPGPGASSVAAVVLFAAVAGALCTRRSNARLLVPTVIGLVLLAVGLVAGCGSKKTGGGGSGGSGGHSPAVVSVETTSPAPGWTFKYTVFDDVMGPLEIRIEYEIGWDERVRCQQVRFVQMRTGQFFTDAFSGILEHILLVDWGLDLLSLDPGPWYEDSSYWDASSAVSDMWHPQPSYGIIGLWDMPGPKRLNEEDVWQGYANVYGKSGFITCVVCIGCLDYMNHNPESDSAYWRANWENNIISCINWGVIWHRGRPQEVRTPSGATEGGYKEFSIDDWVWK